jgi:hypothetical protein
MTGTGRSAAQPDPSGPHSTTWQYECVSKEIRILAMSDGKMLVWRRQAPRAQLEACAKSQILGCFWAQLEACAKSQILGCFWAQLEACARSQILGVFLSQKQGLANMFINTNTVAYACISSVAVHFMKHKHLSADKHIN